MRISDWSSDVCSSDLNALFETGDHAVGTQHQLLIVGSATSKGFAVLAAQIIDGHAVAIICSLINDLDRTSVVYGKSVSVRVAHGGRRIITKKKTPSIHA